MIRLWKDLERCPYLPKDPEYTKWMAGDKKRLAEIDKSREELLVQAHKYISYDDRNIRNMAHFIMEMLHG